MQLLSSKKKYFLTALISSSLLTGCAMESGIEVIAACPPLAPYSQAEKNALADSLEQNKAEIIDRVVIDYFQLRMACAVGER